MLKAVDYDDKQHVGYARGRSLKPGMRDEWMRVFSAHAPQRRPLDVLDLGCGIGRFTPALAETFGGAAYGVEPSERMRAQAEAAPRPKNVSYMAGSAENIPLPDASCDLVLMFLSYHHVRDREAAAREIARVLRADGRLLVRSAFSDRMPDVAWHRYFPRAREVEIAMFPSSEAVEDAFAGMGLQRIAFDSVDELMADSLREDEERLRLKATSAFEHLTEEEIAEGFAAMQAAVREETEPQPVVVRSDLLVLGRR